MAGTFSGRRRRPWPRLRRADDTAGAAMVTFVVGGALLLVGVTTLINVTLDAPPDVSAAEYADLSAKAAEVMRVLLGTTGQPSNWTVNATAIENVTQLGLVYPGSQLKVDPAKFAALAKGNYTNRSPVNGYVDYVEAKKALGLVGYDFHLRAAPHARATDPLTYGVEGMSSYRVAYVGAWLGAVEQPQSVSERTALDAFAIDFDPLPAGAGGDAYPDESATLRTLLVPKLGGAQTQTVISGGSGKYDFQRVPKTLYEARLNAELDPLSHALALAETKNGALDNVGYDKNRDLRAVLGSANLSLQPVASVIAWKEYVDTGAPGDEDDGDYGFIEASPDGGVTWYAITNTADKRSKDTITAPQPVGMWRDRQESITSLNCAPCLGKNEVQIAFRWTADNDNKVGAGWIVDDVTVDTVATSGFKKDFERPEYDLLIIGSKVAQNAFTPGEVKHAIRDYVDVHGGRLLVLGGEQNTNWLQPLFHVGIRAGSPGVASPDPTHPLLTVPNELSWPSYTTENKVWDFTGGNDDQLFHMVVGTGANEHVLSSARLGAFGTGTDEGTVLLSTYLPYTMSDEEEKRFLANLVTFGRYHHLYMEVGPPVPTDVPVATLTRTTVIDRLKADADEDFGEVGFTLYIWRGYEGDTVQTGPRFLPSGPRSLQAAATPLGGGRVELTWQPPATWGSDVPLNYRVWRGTLAGAETPLVTLAPGVTYHNDTGLTAGTTYHYYVAAITAVGEGPPSGGVSATPLSVPSQPPNLAAAGGITVNLLSWEPPLSNGGTPLLTYAIYADTSPLASPPPSGRLVASVAASETSWLHESLAPGATWYYRVVATNMVGSGQASNQAQGAPVTLPSQPLNPQATGLVGAISVAWSPPASHPTGVGITYNIYAGASPLSLAVVRANEPTTEWTETGLAHGVTRYYRITANNPAGESAMSTTATATTARTPDAPQGLTALGLPQKIQLAWAAPSDPGGSPVLAYKIYRNGAYLYTTGTNTTYEDHQAPLGQVTNYNLTAVNAVGEGASTPSVPATALATPSAPLSLTLVNPNGNKIDLTWTAPASNGGSPILGYKIYRSTSPDPTVTGTHIETVLSTTTTHQDNPGNGTFYYAVLAFNANGDGAPRNQGPITT